jgi:LCP family protein required for cell wall assembly
MRTTLKKGTRGSANGNGAYPPEAPLAPGPELDPDPPLQVAAAPPPRRPAGLDGLVRPRSGRSLYRTRRNPLRLLGKLVLWLVVVVLVAAGALAGGVKLYFDYSVAALVATSPEAVAAAKELDAAPAAGEPATAIVIGYDKRAGETDAGSRSDTVMLVRAHPEQNALTLLSFPRDLIVDIPGCTGRPAWTGRINEAYSYCGPRGTLTTVKELTGVPINYMITVNFRAFRTIVDRLGGVYMDVDQRYYNDNEGLGLGQTFATIDLKPGYQHLDGRSALDFVRYRHTDSDLYRVVRQQEFVKAFKQQVSSNWSLFQLPGIVKTVTENVEVAKGGNKPLDSGEVISYARLVYGLPAGNFQQVNLENVSGYNELAVSESDVEDAVARFMNPDVEAPEKALAVATGQKPKRDEAPSPSEVTVEVQNGNGVAGAADDATYLLGQIGYQTSNGGNAQTFDHFHTTVRYDPAAAGSEAAAQQVADLFGDADVEEARASIPGMIRVIVGKTFQGTLGPAPRDTTPESQPAAVVRDPGSVAPLLRPLRKQVDFPIMVPTVREENSSLSTEGPARAYRIEDHRALRLTYTTGAGEYWGIQQTSWTEAPILNGPTLERRIGGREFKLYFSGTKLHMVAFEDGGGAYWVVNTLQNRLSNETMIAIARGLRPLRAPGSQ